MPLSTKRMAELIVQAHDLSESYPVGTPCRYWPGTKQGEGRLGRIRQPYGITRDGHIVTFVTGLAGYILASHVEPEVPQ